MSRCQDIVNDWQARGVFGGEQARTESNRAIWAEIDRISDELCEQMAARFVWEVCTRGLSPETAVREVKEKADQVLAGLYWRIAERVADRAINGAEDPT